MSKEWGTTEFLCRTTAQRAVLIAITRLCSHQKYSNKNKQGTSDVTCVFHLPDAMHIVCAEDEVEQMRWQPFGNTIRCRNTEYEQVDTGHDVR